MDQPLVADDKAHPPSVDHRLEDTHVADLLALGDPVAVEGRGLPAAVPQDELAAANSQGQHLLVGHV